MTSHITTDPNRLEPALCGAAPDGTETHMLPHMVEPTRIAWEHTGQHLDLCPACELFAEMALWPG